MVTQNACIYGVYTSSYLVYPIFAFYIDDISKSANYFTLLNNDYTKKVKTVQICS